MVSRILVKLAEDAAIAIGGAVIATAVKHVGPAIEKNAPDAAEAAKKGAAAAFGAAKKGTTNAANTAKVVGKAAKNRFGR